ncbi:MAG: Gfo/Idh/MocA family oxidoreductase [Deltaproteobacteria bacterium]|nr:Gfo/Idh/MocA family oxidoreductase [Deltaproteobacteria bacterium]
MTARIEVVVAGLGHMGGLHARALGRRPDVRVRVVDPGRGHPGPVGRPDAAIVAVPAVRHAEVALPLLDAGVPCLVEKPLAPDPDAAEALAAWPDCMPGHVERFNPVFCALPGLRARFLVAERIHAPTGRGADVDVVLDVMIHDLDLALWLLGEEPDEIRASGLAVRSACGVDIANARLETASGGAAVLTASRVSRRQVRALRVFTLDAYVSMDLAAGRADRVRWGAAGLEEEAVPVPAGDALEREHDAFLAHVRQEAPFPVPAADAARAVRLARRVQAAISPPR